MSTFFKSNAPAYRDLLDVWKKSSKPVIFWVGAGLSAPSKLPTWNELRKTIETELLNAAESSGAAMRQSKLALLNSAREQQSMWKKFELLAEGLGPATFQAIITRELNLALKCQIPTYYEQIWNLRIKGIISLNIDRFAYRGFQRSSANKENLEERNGFEIRSLIGATTKSDGRFIANLHGHLEDPMSWVFTEKKLQALIQDQHYREFVRDAIKYCTIIFVGISVHDHAVISHFKNLQTDLLNFGPHFWISDIDDPLIAQEVESSGIQLITYQNTNRNHTEIGDILRDLKQANPTIEPSEPVFWENSIATPKEEIPSPQDIITLSPNKARVILNGAAKSIITSTGIAHTQEFLDFCKKYSRAIHSASFFDSDPNNDADRVIGYKIADYQKEGGFAKVWQGFSDDGTPVAIKEFRYEIREKPELLDSFRRGVRSMQLLSEERIPGIVQFLAASEIPPVAIMEWIDGATLHEAVLQNGINNWSSKIYFLRTLARIIYAAHNSRARVLHRDLRPQNIMLRNYYSDPQFAEVVVLDFDLSWHVGALEKSVYVGGGTAYLAPEQLSAYQGATTRSALVDSFGFGMTMYFLLSRNDPIINMYLKPSWATDVYAISNQQTCKEWRSIPNQVARLIVASTRPEQSKRLAFSQILAKIEQLGLALDSPENLIDPQMVAEEIFTRTDAISTYDLTDSAWPRYVGASGLTITTESLTNVNGFRLLISFMQQGHERFKDLSLLNDYIKKIPERFFSKTAYASESRSIGRNFAVSIDFEIIQGDNLVESISHDLNTVTNRIISLLTQ